MNRGFALALLLLPVSASAGNASAYWTTDGKRVALISEDSGFNFLVTIDFPSRAKGSFETQGPMSCLSEDPKEEAACQERGRRAFDEFAKHVNRYTSLPGMTENPKFEMAEVVISGSSASIKMAGRPAHATELGKAQYAEVWWSPDGQWAVVGGTPYAYEENFTVVPGVARVDLLDAVKGADAAGVATTLSAAGWAPAHQAKAKDPRKETEIFVAAGFEDDGKAIAKLLGLTDAAVKPLTWGSRYAVTVALGASK